MTIVVALKVGDGLVLGADSASTVTLGPDYYNSYFNAEKLFNLRKTFPIGALTYGLGGLSGRSISSLAKDLRERFTDLHDNDYYLNPLTYTMREVAEKARRFFYEERFVPEHGTAADEAYDMGLIFAGYSAQSRTAEIWEIRVASGQCAAPHQVGATKNWFIRFEGQIEALNRLVRGWSFQTLDRLVGAGMSAGDAQTLLDAVQPIISETMPIQDAIDLVHYLIDVTCGFVRFSPGHATVAQPIDSAAITPHEGFRWIRRKHYFSPVLNTPAPRETA